jgi:hypothetical protein
MSDPKGITLSGRLPILGRNDLTYLVGCEHCDGGVRTGTRALCRCVQEADEFTGTWAAIQVVDYPSSVNLTVGGPTEATQADCQEYATAMADLACLVSMRTGKAADVLCLAGAEIRRLRDLVTAPPLRSWSPAPDETCLCGLCSHARSRGEAPPHTTPTLRSSEVSK